MKIVKMLATECANGVQCPEIGLLEDGTLLVRGYKVTDPDDRLALGLPPHEDAVIIPASLLARAREAM
jgi:hypothetical protein